MRKFVVLGSLVVLAGCSPNPHQNEEVAARSGALASIMGGAEAAIDAPWRLEPENHNGSWSYPTIPIVLSIHDASMQPNPNVAVPLGTFCDLTIVEESVGTTVVDASSSLLGEIERSDVWPYEYSDVAANHRLCRRWAGESCAGELDVGSSAEWHATVLYPPGWAAPGGDVHLTVQARVSRAGQPCGPRQGIKKSAKFDRVAPLASDVGNGDLYLVNELSVHVGEAPLPRFDGGWAYGDLHYHSQGTDNEGESGYAYRPTLQAMRAMGLDFLFATDHASDSGQTTDIEDIYIELPPAPDLHIPLPVEARLPWTLLLQPAADRVVGLINGLDIGGPILAAVDAARDMNDQRWRAMLAWLNAPSGGNAEVLKTPGRTAAPRIFLGGEVDVIPEISAAEAASGILSYGNGRGFDWTGACSQVPDAIRTAEKFTTFSVCHGAADLLVPTVEGNRYKLRDLQGLGQLYYARQHMIVLPSDGTRADNFVASRTTQYGGASRRLSSVDPQSNRDDGVLAEVAGKGYAFLAHPATAASGTGTDRLGPDIVPYSEVQLRTAFESKTMLGLQLWNEDDRLVTSKNAPRVGFPIQNVCSSVEPGCEGTPGPNGEVVYPVVPSMWQWMSTYGNAPAAAYGQLADGIASWEKMLLWGMRRSQTAGIAWLPAGTPRRVFMAGGSDAHGDWNYRRQGAVDGFSSAVDTAIGKPRNLVHVGAARPETVNAASGATVGALGQTQVTDALASGDFSVTDGPALRIAVDANGNGIIDAGDVPMGGLTSYPTNGATLPFVVEWKSSAEFGAIAGIDLYVGAANDGLDMGLVYAPPNHGAYGSAVTLPDAYMDADGRTHRQLTDGYMADPTGNLHIVPGASETTEGRRVVNLRATDYVLGYRRVYYPPPECRENVTCHDPYFARCEPVCTQPRPPSYTFDDVSEPDRIFVRAFARTVRKGGARCSATDAVSIDVQKRGDCVERLAFTNPIWASSPPHPICAPDPLATTCAGKQCGQAVDNCGKSVLCPNTCEAPAVCNGGGAGANACGDPNLPETVYSGYSGLRGVAVRGTDLFFLDWWGELWKGNTTGTAAPVRLAYTGSPYAFGLAVDPSTATHPDSYVYWGGGFDGKIYRTPMGGGTTQTLAATPCGHMATLILPTDGDSVFGACYTDGKFYKVPRAGGSYVTFDTGTTGIIGGHERAGYLYFGHESISGNSGVYKVSSTLTGEVTKAFETLPSTGGLEWLSDDGTYVYWTDYYGTNLTRARRDGSGQARMMAGVDNAVGVAVDPADPYAYVSLYSTGKIVRIWTSAQSLASACAGKQCGPATTIYGQAFTCPNSCGSPNTCGGGGVGPNACGCTSTGNPCGLRCNDHLADNCGTVYSCHADCGTLGGICGGRGGRCGPAHYCECSTAGPDY